MLNVATFGTAIPFNEIDSPRNYLSKVRNYARLLEATNSFSQLDEFVAACLDCWTRRVPFGIYNVTNTGSMTTRQITDMVRQHLDLDRQFDFFESEAEFMRLAAKTPRSNCVLDNSKLLSTGVMMSSVEDAMERARNWKSASQFLAFWRKGSAWLPTERGTKESLTNMFPN